MSIVVNTVKPNSTIISILCLLLDLRVPPGQRQQLQKRRDNKPTPPLLLFRILLMLLMLMLVLVLVLVLLVMVFDCLAPVWWL